MPLPSTPTLYRANGDSQPLPPANGRDYTIAELQAAVGGYVEVLRLPGTDWIVCLNEDGKGRLPLNDFATIEATMLGAIFPADTIVGDVVVCPSAMLK